MAAKIIFPVFPGPRKQNTTLEQYIMTCRAERIAKEKKKRNKLLVTVNLTDSGILSTDAYCSRKTFCWRVGCLREAKLPCLLPESGVLVDYLPKRGDILSFGSAKVNRDELCLRATTVLVSSSFLLPQTTLSG
ncbi:hypothetical protein CDAR_253101 [Caerostris darwini]|uniref:Uncharacterized protein n=1 Tax=Caerostris darwini TaxID=1538125 RepID=A0AAV4R775_9ARAC|nr:hypothetical protein CDAR_253101 [Caerostris darwini]